MKYWLFDGKDALGPYEPEELKRLPGFTPDSLICPDGAASADQWRPSQYYLVKPPPAKTSGAGPSARSSPAISRGMGRIADAGLAEEPPSADPPPRQAFAPRRSVSAGALLSAFLAALAAGGGIYVLNLHRAKPPAAAPSPSPAPAPKPAAEPPAKPAVTDAQIQDATQFVRTFPTQSAGRRLPASPENVFSPRRWKAAATVGEALEMRGLLPLDEAAQAVLEKQGRSPREGERELRRAGRRWQRYAARFQRALEPLTWEVDRSQACPTQTSALGEPTCFEVRALLRSQRGGPQQTHAFVADLTARTLKPQDTDAWEDIDPRGLAKWASRHVRLGEPIDETAAAQAAAAYGFPLNHRRRPRPPRVAQRRPAPRPTGAQAAPASSGDGLDYTQPGLHPARPKAAAARAESSDDQALEKALLGGEPSRAQASPAPAGAPAASAQPPAGASAAQPPAQPATQPAAPAQRKSAMDMSVDELQKYLERDSSASGSSGPTP